MSIGSRYTISTAPPSSGPGFTGVVSSGLAIGAVLLFVGLAAAQAESNALTLPDSLAVASSDSLAVASSDSLTEAAPDTIVAVLPFANLTGNREAPPLLLPLVHQQLIRQGVSYRTALAIRPILRRHRIRTVGSISRSGAELLRGTLGRLGLAEKLLDDLIGIRLAGAHRASHKPHTQQRRKQLPHRAHPPIHG